MGLWSIFFLNLIFFILSFQTKQKLVQKTQKQKNGIWSKWRRNRPKSTKIVPLHRRGGPGGPRWDFCRFRPHFKRLPFIGFQVFFCNFFVCLKAEHLNFHFPQKYWPWAHFWPSYGVQRMCCQKRGIYYACIVKIYNLL